ncbi:MAG: FG-GAP-like repeat-containing protein, partial [Bacteroidota bacterium]
DGTGDMGTPQESSFNVGPNVNHVLNIDQPLLADFDGDGTLDVAGVQDRNSSATKTSVPLVTMVGQGDGTFSSAVGHQIGGGTAQNFKAINPALADVDNDGDLDVYFFQVLQGNVQAFIGNGVRPAIPGGSGAPPPASIAVTSAAPVYWPLGTATINVDVANVVNLQGVSADLAYPSATTTHNASLAAGAFLNDGTMLTTENDDDAGTVSFGVSRTGASGATGSGTAASMTFTVADRATPGAATFTLSDLAAVDADGSPITFAENTAGSFVIGGVWPGDADNNCTVEVADVLALGLNFGDTGPARTGYDLSWSPKAFSPWTTFADSFVDTDGDGEIDEGDILAIGVNFSETHAEATGCTPAASKRSTSVSWMLAALPVGSEVTLSLEQLQAHSDLLGTTFKLSVDPSAVRVEAVEAGTWLDNGDLLELVMLDAQTGEGEAAFSRKGSESAVQGTGELALVRLTVLREMESEVTLRDVRVSTVSGGVASAGSGVVLQEAISTSNEAAGEVPTEFVVHGAYPNPFNPSTTLSFDLPEAATVQLQVFDLLGRQVSVQALGQLDARARHQVLFDAANLSSGTYVYRIEAVGASATMHQTGRFVLLK